MKLKRLLGGLGALAFLTTATVIMLPHVGVHVDWSLDKASAAPHHNTNDDGGDKQFDGGDKQFDGGDKQFDGGDKQFDGDKNKDFSDGGGRRQKDKSEDDGGKKFDGGRPWKGGDKDQSEEGGWKGKDKQWDMDKPKEWPRGGYDEGPNPQWHPRPPKGGEDCEPTPSTPPPPHSGGGGYTPTNSSCDCTTLVGLYLKAGGQKRPFGVGVCNDAKKWWGQNHPQWNGRTCPKDLDAPAPVSVPLPTLAPTKVDFFGPNGK